MPTTFQPLRRSVAGTVVEPSDPAWDRARQPWNLAVDQRPAAVVEAAGADDVRAVVDFARANGLRVAPQATGHGAGRRPSLESCVLLKTAALRDVAVFDGSARAGAGAVAGQVADAAGAHGLAPVAGLSPGVGVTGLALAGGIGWLGRAHGLACNNVRAFDVVTASGEALHVDAESEPELFWALRGGGAPAVVTSIELDLHPVEEAFAGMVAWPAETAGEVLGQFRRFTAEAPETLTAILRYLSLPDIPAVPPPLRGRRIVAVIAVHLGSEAEGARLLDPLRASRTALVDTFAPVPAARLVRVAGDPEDPSPGLGHGLLLEDLTDELAGTMAELIETDALAPLVAVELRQLGGALARAPHGHGALAALDGRFSVFATGIAADAAARGAIEERLEALRAALEPWTSPRTLLGFGDAPLDPATAFASDVLDRLSRVREQYDPDGVIA